MNAARFEFSVTKRNGVAIAGECSFLEPWTVLMCFMSYDFKGGMQQNRNSQGSTKNGNGLKSKN